MTRNRVTCLAEPEAVLPPAIRLEAYVAPQGSQEHRFLIARAFRG